MPMTGEISFMKCIFYIINIIFLSLPCMSSDHYTSFYVIFIFGIILITWMRHKPLPRLFLLLVVFESVLYIQHQKTAMVKQRKKIYKFCKIEKAALSTSNQIVEMYKNVSNKFLISHNLSFVTS